MALFPFILVKKPEYQKVQSLIRHEKIHLIQQLELFVVLFYVLYVLNYIINLIIYRNHHKAYFNIIFEKEAYENDCKPGYLKSRKRYSWFRYLL